MPPIDILPGEIVVLTRDQTREQYLAAYRLRNPDALTTEGTLPWIDAVCLADMLQALYRNAVVVNNGITILTCQKAAVDQRLKELGLFRLPAIGGSGYVIIQASGGGTTIFAGDEIKETNSGLRFKCAITTATQLFLNGDFCPVAGIDLGEQTNLPGGTQLTWTAPRPGCLSNALVVTQADGTSGLTGGHGLEGDESAIARAISIRANPPASGNDAEYQLAIESTPGIAVEKGFTYPAILGAGTMSFVFTIRASAPGASRIPNGAQVTAVNTYLSSVMPADDMIFAATITAQSVDTAVKVIWARGAPTWVDTGPWPEYFPTGAKAIVVSAATDATHFTLRSDTNVYTSVRQPTAGQTFGIYDTTGQLFRRKKILSFTGTGPWVITCDTTAGASDTTYVPQVGQRASPWSESLNDLAPAIVGYFDGLGPGEQAASFFDAGTRMRRSPESPAFWPSAITNRLTVPLLALPSVQDAVVVEPAIPFQTTVGTFGTSSLLITLRWAAAFPEV